MDTERETILRIAATQTIDAYRADLLTLDELVDELVTLLAAHPAED